MVDNDNKYNNKIINKIINKNDIKEIDYINEYNDYYIVKGKEYLYVFDNKYNEIFKIDCVLIYENKNNYDIIYKDELLMYLNDYYKDNKLVYEYYDLYTYKLLDKIVLGG